MSRVKVIAVALMAVASVMVSASQAWALGYNIGDVFASVASGDVKQFTSTGTLIQTLSSTCCTGFTTGSAFDSSGNFYVTNFSENRVTKFDTNGVVVTDFSGQGSNTESIVFDAAGNIFVGNTSSGLRKLDSSGALLTSYATGRVDFFDIAADQTTIFFTQEGSQIRRFDTTTNSLLSDFASGISGTAFAIRILTDGGVLLADAGNIKRFDAAGAQIQTYDTGSNNSWFALNLDPDGLTFWSGDFGTSQICRFVIATGALVNCFSSGTGGSTLFGVSVFGEITVVDPPDDGAVPEPASLILVGTGALGLLARYRRRLLRQV
jgi:streptogramin lyase